MLNRFRQRWQGFVDICQERLRTDFWAAVCDLAPNFPALLDCPKNVSRLVWRSTEHRCPSERQSKGVLVFDTEQRFGGFGGIGYSPNDAWTLTASVELGAEAVVGMSARYHFQ